MSDPILYTCTWIDSELYSHRVDFSVRRRWYGCDFEVHYAGNTIHMQVKETHRGIALYKGLKVVRRTGYHHTVADALDWLAHEYGCALQCGPELPLREVM